MYQTQNTQKYGVYLHKIKKKSQEYQEKVPCQLSADEPRSVFRRFVTTYTGPHTSGLHTSTLTRGKKTTNGAAATFISSSAILRRTQAGPSTVQYSTVQYSTVQYSTVQYSTVQYSAEDPVPAPPASRGQQPPALQPPEVAAPAARRQRAGAGETLRGTVTTIHGENLKMDTKA